MDLIRVSEKVWFAPYEEERDRPNLGYIRGERWSLAVDAGHSDAHVEEFYAALEKNGLPLPALTVLTHWHWDHTFGLHRIRGLSVANARTNSHLAQFKDRIAKEGAESFLSLDASIRKEYAGGRPVVIVPADMEFEGELRLDAGKTPIRLFEASSPHTDDSTLVYLPGEKILFLGDAPCGEFPTWEQDREKTLQFIRTIEAIDASICISSHWLPQTKEELLAELKN